MSERMMFKIGEFARVGQVSIATLRYYDQYGLLKPDSLDPDTGYRYYSPGQLPRLHRVLALKELGFPLEQIVQLLEENLSLEQLQGMFRLKQAEIQQMIVTEQVRLARLAARLRQLDQEGKMPAYEVLLKQVAALRVASIRQVMPIGADLDAAYKEITSYLDQQHVSYSQPALRLLHSRYALHDDGFKVDIETAVPLTTDLPGNAQINVRTLPAGLMACIVHVGTVFSLGPAFMSLSRWIKDNGYQVIDVPRQVYLQRAEDIDPHQYVTEVQFPVKPL